MLTAVSVYQVTLEVNVRPTLMTALQILASMAAAARYKKQEERNIIGTLSFDEIVHSLSGSSEWL